MKAVNFVKLLTELKNAGIPHQEVAKETGLTPVGICHLWYGRSKEPKHRAGEIIIAMHKKYCVIKPSKGDKE